MFSLFYGNQLALIAVVVAFPPLPGIFLFLFFFLLASSGEHTPRRPPATPPFPGTIKNWPVSIRKANALLQSTQATAAETAKYCWPVWHRI